MRSGVWEGSWQDVLKACHRDRCDLGASRSAVALLGAELVADAGGLPEAAAELAQALRTPRLVACVADGAIGPHFQSHAVPPWRRWLRRWLSRCFRRSASVVEIESSRALAVAMFHCKATPVILSSQGFPEEISEVTSAVLLADDLDSCDRAASKLRQKWPRAAVVGAVGARWLMKDRPVPSLAALGAEGGFPSGPCGTVRLGNGAVALLLHGPRLKVLRCDGMRAVPPALPVTRLADSAEGGDATVERLAGAPAWSKLMEVFKEAPLEDQLELRSHRAVVRVRTPDGTQSRVRMLRRLPNSEAVCIPGAGVCLGSTVQLLVRHRGVAEENLRLLPERIALERAMSPSPWLGCLVFADRARGQHFTAGRDAAAAAAALRQDLEAAVAGGFCRGQLGMAPGAPAAVERLSAVFGFLTDGEDEEDEDGERF